MTAAAVAIRPARTGDLPAIVALWRESMRLHGDRDPSFAPRPDGHIAFGRFVEARIASHDARVLVAEGAGGRVLAYGVCVLRRRPDYFEPCEHGLVTDLDVAAEARRQGLGERLLEALCEWLRARRVARVEAEVVSANEVSRAFWRKRGFATHYEAMHRRP